MKNLSFFKHTGYGKFILVFVLLFGAGLACGAPISIGLSNPGQPQQLAQTPEFQFTPGPQPTLAAGQAVVPTYTPNPSGGIPSTGGNAAPAGAPTNLIDLHNREAPGVVNIHVVVNSGGQSGFAAGSGFLVDGQKHIVTNNHVVEGATQVTVTWFNGIESDAKVIGTDPDSDLAVLQVSDIPGGVHPLTLGDSNNIQVGEWVVAIGNPFDVGGSMSEGIISGMGRTIQSLTPFSIPQAIQTDAAINPGNSGWPLIDMSGSVIGVNAQIATNGQQNAGSGVGFAIPSNIVRKVIPVLISKGSYQWPWLGIEGTSVDLAIQSANNLPTQQGAYITNIVQGGPASQAGLRGANNVSQLNSGSATVPTGGDVVIAADGQPITSFDDLLIATDNKNPGDQMTLTILRNGQKQDVKVTLAPRPANLNQNQNSGNNPFQIP